MQHVQAWFLAHYDFFHDFAAPIATIFAALVAIGVTFFFNMIQTRIARQQARTAALQAQLAAVRLKHDLYDRRFDLYSAAHSILRHVLVTQNVPNDALGSYIRGIGNAPFLVNQEVVDYLYHLHAKADRLQVLSRRNDLNHLPVGEERSKVVDEASALCTWFMDQQQVLISKFMPYLRLDETDLAPPL